MAHHLDFKIDRDELAERLGGGIPRGSLIVIEAPYGAGKSILTQRLLFGLLSCHHSVGAVSTELTTLGFIEQMRSLDYPVERHLLTGDLLFLPVYPLVSARRVPHDLLARLRCAEDLFAKELVLIDTFSKLLAEQHRSHTAAPVTRSLVLEHRAGSAALNAEEALAAEVEETIYDLKRRAAAGKTIILTVEPEQVAPSILRLLRDTSDVHLTLEFSLLGNNATRRIVVNRFSRAKGRIGDVIGYRVEPGIGLVIEIKSVA
jgi:archaeal flagellar protein FlaH